MGKRTWYHLCVNFGAILPFLGSAAVAAGAPPVAPALSPGEIVATAPAGEWVAIARSDLLVMDLAPLNGAPRRVVIQLMPPPFSQGWVGNIRRLAAAHWWDGTSVNRVQDNYVAQWGDPDSDDKAKAKALPGGLVAVPEKDYTVSVFRDMALSWKRAAEQRQAKLREAAAAGDQAAIRATLLEDFSKESFTVAARAYGGWQYGTDLRNAWPVHCYGMVGVGRDLPPDTGTGAELYTVIGHAPRHLDRNIALVGRVISGIEHLSSLPRGAGPLGVYDKPEQRVRIVSIRLGNEVAGLPRYQYLSTESASFARYADARANRRDAFFIVPAGGADICNVPVPVRAVP